MVKLIGLSGAAGSGKSTAAAYLVESHGFTLVKFATPLKNMLRSIGLTDEEIEGPLKETPNPKLCGRTPRHAMQTLGTEWGRHLIDDELWINLWGREARKHERVVCDDVRFHNEAGMIRGCGGWIVGLIGRGGISGTHMSEAGVNWDEPLDNSGNIVNLQLSLDKIVKAL